MCWAAKTQSDDQYLGVLIGIGQEATDLVAFFLLMYIYRPRKEWPDFYGLGLQQFMGRQAGAANAGGNNARVQQEINMAQQPITTFTITNTDVFDFLFGALPATKDDSASLATLQTGDPILVINPCQVCHPDIVQSGFKGSDNPYSEDVS